MLNNSFLEAMEDISKLGVEKYGEKSFQMRQMNGDETRGDMLRNKSDEICLHAHSHLTAYQSRIEHDHFQTLKHQLAACAFNCMMEFYYLEREQPKGRK